MKMVDDDELASGLVNEYLLKNPSMFADPDVWVYAAEYASELLRLGDTADSVELILRAVDTCRRYGGWVDRAYLEHRVDRGVSGPHLVDACSALARRAASGPAQGSGEWLNLRKKYFTATDVDKLLGSQAAFNSVIYAKCNNFAALAGFDSTFVGGARGHGTKYEPLSARVYELTFGVKTDSLAFVPHESTEYLGCSPDGIVASVDAEHGDSFRIGRLVEFKNPVSGNRGDLDGDPPKKWWTQAQMQMESCNVDELDFVTTLFREVSMSTLLDPDAGGAAPARGAVVHLARAPTTIVKLDEHGNAPAADSVAEQMYRYQEPMLLDPTRSSEDVRSMIRNFVRSVMSVYEPLGYVHVSTSYWYLEDFSCVLIPRNRAWFASVEEKLYQAWKCVCEERASGAWTARAPKTRKPVPETCMFDRGVPPL